MISFEFHPKYRDFSIIVHAFYYENKFTKSTRLRVGAKKKNQEQAIDSIPCEIIIKDKSCEIGWDLK